MRFLLKSTFMIFLLLLVVPFFAPFLLDRPVPREEQAMPTGSDIGGAISAARGTIDYMSGICSDRPDVCEDGAGLLGYLGNRARQGAEIVYLYLGQHFGDDAKQPETVTKSGRMAPQSDIVAATPPAMDPVRTGAIAEAVIEPGPVPNLAAPTPPTRIPGLPENVPVPTPRPR